MKNLTVTLLTLLTCSIGATYAQNTQDNCQYFGETSTRWEGTIKGELCYSTKGDHCQTHSNIASIYTIKENNQYFLILGQPSAPNQIKNKQIQNKLATGKIPVKCVNGNFEYRAEGSWQNPDMEFTLVDSIKGKLTSANEMTYQRRLEMRQHGGNGDYLTLKIDGELTKR
jgi:hypothetical protein